MNFRKNLAAAMMAKITQTSIKSPKQLLSAPIEN